jgi:hypothetical protein
VKLRMLVLAIALVIQVPAMAQSNAELTQIREQLLQLTQRVDRLEQENVALRNENATLKSPSAAMATAAPAAVKNADWPNRIVVKGDLRYRHEQTDDESLASERGRHLLRARASIEAKTTQSMLVGVGMSTTENGNPRGANQTLDGEFSRKSLDLDFAYFDWTLFEDVHAIGGKMKTPFFRPGQSLFFDNDVNPEGLAFTYDKGPWFGTAFGYWIDENVPVTNTTPTDADTMMFGGQFGVKLPVGASSLSVAAMYYDLAAAKGRRPFFNAASNGNTTIGTGTAAVLANDFRVAWLSAEFNTSLGGVPFQLWADVAQNQAAELDTAYMVGALLGKASNAKTWEAAIAYESLQKDALFAQHIDSDFAGGFSDSEGWIFRAGYAPIKNWSLNAAYFMARRNVDVGQPFDLDRLLIDFNVKY